LLRTWILTQNVGSYKKLVYYHMTEYSMRLTIFLSTNICNHIYGPPITTHWHNYSGTYGAAELSSHLELTAHTLTMKENGG